MFVALTLVVALAAPAGASAKTCGSFTHTYRYTVSATGGLKCASALRIVKSFIKNHKAVARAQHRRHERRHLLHDTATARAGAAARAPAEAVLLAREALRELREPLRRNSFSHATARREDNGGAT